MADRPTTQFYPGGFQLLGEAENFIAPTPPEPSDNSQTLGQPGPSSTDGISSNAHHSTSRRLHPKTLQPTDVRHKQNDIGGLGLGLSLKYSSPWGSYSKDYRRQLGSSVVIIYKRSATSQLFAMKDITGSDTDHKVNVLQQIQHENLISAFEVFQFNNTTSIIFEYMAVSLDNINSSALRPNELQIATIIHQVSSIPGEICRYLLKAKVLNGIAFLASKGMVHGDITCSTVLISREGDVKIGNVKYSNA